MKVIVIEGSPEEVNQYLRLQKYRERLVPQHEPPRYGQAPNMNYWDAPDELVIPWAEARMGKELSFTMPGEDPHRCHVVAWERAGTGIHLLCKHPDGKTFRLYADKVLRRKETA